MVIAVIFSLLCSDACDKSCVERKKEKKKKKHRQVQILIWNSSSDLEISERYLIKTPHCSKAVTGNEYTIKC